MSEPRSKDNPVLPPELLAHASSMHLCIHLNPRWIGATLADAASGHVHWIFEQEITQHHTGRWEDACAFMATVNWSDRVFRKCTITYDTAIFTIIPSAFFQRERMMEILEFQTGRKCARAEEIHLNELHAELVYEPSADLQMLAGRYPNARMFPLVAILARYALMNGDRTGPSIHVWSAPSSMILGIFNQRQLQLLNHYDANAAEDVLYHTANAALRLGIDLEHTPVYIYPAGRPSDIVDLFAQYNRNTQAVLAKSGDSPVTQMHLACV